METIAVAVSFALVIGLPIAWLTTELLESRKLLRIVLGLACIGVFLGCLITAEEIVTFQQRAHARCFRQISVLLDKGDVDTVKRAVADYNKDGKCSALAAEAILSAQDGQN
jgi:hypothetical protein